MDIKYGKGFGCATPEARLCRITHGAVFFDVGILQISPCFRYSETQIMLPGHGYCLSGNSFEMCSFPANFFRINKCIVARMQAYNVTAFFKAVDKDPDMFLLNVIIAFKL